MVSMMSSASLQSSSRGSIMNKDVLKQLKHEEIKESSVNPIDKQVLQWTPVVIGTNFPQRVQKTKVEYIGGDILNK